MNDVITFVFEFIQSLFALVIIPDVQLGNNSYSVTLGSFLITALIMSLVLALFLPKWRNT